MSAKNTGILPVMLVYFEFPAPSLASTVWRNGMAWYTRHKHTWRAICLEACAAIQETNAWHSNRSSYRAWDRDLKPYYFRCPLDHTLLEEVGSPRLSGSRLNTLKIIKGTECKRRDPEWDTHTFHISKAPRKPSDDRQKCENDEITGRCTSITSFD